MLRLGLAHFVSPARVALGASSPRTWFTAAAGQTRALAKQQRAGHSGSGKGKAMRGVKKENLPSKVCVTCNRPFTWRKKWERCWDEITTCSKRCNAERRAAAGKGGKGGEEGSSDSGGDKVAGRRGPGGMGELSTASLNAPSKHGDRELQEGSEAGLDAKAERRAAKKAQKAARRAQREGRGDGGAGQKQCDSCSKMSDLLIRCTTDESGVWRMVCGRCWQSVSGGVADGDAAHPHYRYGGLWKNRRAATEPPTKPPPLNPCTTQAERQAP